MLHYTWDWWHEGADLEQESLPYLQRQRHGSSTAAFPFYVSRIYGAIPYVLKIDSLSPVDSDCRSVDCDLR